MKALIRNRGRRGFTLIELMIVVAIIGILAVLAIYGVSRYLKSAKTAEATNNVGQMGKNAQEAWTREKMSGSIVSAGSSVKLSQALCKSALAKVPTAGVPKAEKYVSGISDWGGDQYTGFVCLRYSVDQPQYYQYDYQSDSTASAPGTNFQAIARGDLDGNNTTSVFQLGGAVDATSGQLVIAPTLLITNETE